MWKMLTSTKQSRHLATIKFNLEFKTRTITLQSFIKTASQSRYRPSETPGNMKPFKTLD